MKRAVGTMILIAILVFVAVSFGNDEKDVKHTSPVQKAQRILKESRAYYFVWKYKTEKRKEDYFVYTPQERLKVDAQAAKIKTTSPRSICNSLQRTYNKRPEALARKWNSACAGVMFIVNAEVVILIALKNKLVVGVSTGGETTIFLASRGKDQEQQEEIACGDTLPLRQKNFIPKLTLGDKISVLCRVGPFNKIFDALKSGKIKENELIEPVIIIDTVEPQRGKPRLYHRQ